MKILFIVNKLRSGGAERVTASLSNEFVRLGHAVSVAMISETERYSHYPVDERVNLIPIQNPGQRKSRIKGVLWFINLRLLRKCIIENAPDVIISFLHRVQIYAYLANRGLGVPHIVSERNDPEKCPKRKLLRALRSYVFSRAEGCVFQTGGAQMFFSVPIRNKSAVIPNPVVITYEPSRLCEREKTITAAGRLELQKNYDMMIRAFSLFLEDNPEYKLVIYGEGWRRSFIEQLINDMALSDNVILMGHIKNLHEAIHDSAIFALSSNYEGMPNSLLEAMALGIPSVSTDCPCGGPSELIQNNENGILVPVGDVRAMAAAFCRITGDSKFADKLSRNARQVKSLYSVERIADRWIEYIHIITDKKYGKVKEK